MARYFSLRSSPRYLSLFRPPTHPGNVPLLSASEQILDDRRAGKGGRREKFFQNHQKRNVRNLEDKNIDNVLTTMPPTELLDNNDEQRGVNAEIPYPKQIVKYLDEYVIGQHEAKRYLAVGVYQHYKRVRYNQELQEEAILREQIIDWIAHRKQQDRDGRQIINEKKLYTKQLGFDLPTKKNDNIMLEKSNIVLLGPSGSGKTYLTMKLAEALNVPIAMCDCTTLTQAGYVGDDVDTVIQQLLLNSGGDIAAAEQGIVLLDEFDKIYTSSDPMHTSGNRDVNGKGVQQALLKMVEGTRLRVKTDAGKVEVDTSNILFIASGAFSNLDRIVARRLDQRSLGFNSSSNNLMEQLDAKDEKIASAAKTQLLSQADQGDLITFGMVPELVGRFPVMVALETLDQEALKRVLTEPRNSLVSQAQKLFNLDAINLEFTRCALDEMAGMAVRRKTGARALRSILEKTLLEAKYECPGTADNSTVIISGAVVRGETSFKRIDRE